MEKVNIETAFEKLIAGNRNIYFEVDVVEIQEQKQTQQGNCFFRIKIKDETLDAILVVWGSNWNQPNLKIFETLAPKRIRVIRPRLPSQWALEQYGVDFWADEIRSKIELI